MYDMSERTGEQIDDAGKVPDAADGSSGLKRKWLRGLTIRTSIPSSFESDRAISIAPHPVPRITMRITPGGELASRGDGRADRTSTVVLASSALGVAAAPAAASVQPNVCVT